MKKTTIIGAALSLAMTLGMSGIVSAAPNTPPQTDVTGVITANFVPVQGAAVEALCNGHTQMDTTDAHGSYLTIFSTTDCAFGSTVKITASKGGHSGVMTGTVQGITTKLNLAIVNVSIPEYGLFGGIAAGGAGLGIIAYKRRRTQGLAS